MSYQVYGVDQCKKWFEFNKAFANNSTEALLHDETLGMGLKMSVHSCSMCLTAIEIGNRIRGCELEQLPECFRFPSSHPPYFFRT
jgi:hypothetical protein